MLLICLSLVNVYRAVTQSITYDEAVTYDAFVVGPFSNAFIGYNANNHVLFTVLAKLTTRTIGTSELGLRLPSVVAGAVYFGVVFLLCRLLFGRGALFSMAAGAMALNPLVLDFLSAARGYGLALALFMVAFFHAVILVCSFSDGVARTRRWMVVSLALGGSVSANPAFLFPAVGLGLTVMLMAAFDAPRPWRTSVRDFARTMVFPLCVPGPMLAAALLVVPLSLARREHFEYGASRFGETVTSLVNLSLHHHPWGWPGDTFAARIEHVEARLLIPLIAAVLLVTTVVVVIRAARARSLSVLALRDRALLLLSGTLGATLAVLLAAHRLWGVPYPLDRTGLYFIPLFVLAVAVLAERAQVPGQWAAPARACWFVLLGILVGQSAFQFSVTQYALWRFDAGTRTLYEITAAWPQSHPNTSFRVAASWLLQPSFNHYRLVHSPSRIASVSDGLTDVDTKEFDFAVVSDGVWGDLRMLRDVGLPVCTHPVSGAVLFVNRTSPAAAGLNAIRGGVSGTTDCEHLLQRLLKGSVDP